MKRLYTEKDLKKRIAIGITTFLRDDCLYKCLDSINTHYPFLKIYIAEQGHLTEEKKEKYKQLRSNGHRIKILPFDSGISYARKVLKNLIKEEFILFIQDDFVFNENSKIEHMLDVMDNDNTVGIVGGKVNNAFNKKQLECYEYYFCEINKKLLYLPCDWLIDNKILKWNNTNYTKYYYADIVLDFTLWRKEVENIFDAKVKVIEHSHTYLQLKHKTDWKIAYTPQSSICHSHGRIGIQYHKYRSRKQDIEYIQHYWNIDEFIWMDKYLPKIFNKKDDGIIFNSKNPHTKYSAHTIEILEKMVEIFELEKLDYCLIKKTCLNYIRHDEFELPISIAYTGNLNDLEVILVNNNFIKINETSYEIKGININFYNEYYSRLKVGEPIGDTRFQVPYPVVSYLNNTFGKNWGKI